MKFNYALPALLFVVIVLGAFFLPGDITGHTTLSGAAAAIIEAKGQKVISEDEREKVFGICDDSRITTVQFMGKSVKVHKDLVQPLSAVEESIKKSGVSYNFYSVGGYRCTTNTNKDSEASSHASGIAIDINPKENPNAKQGSGNCKTDIPDPVVQAFLENGFCWGGYFNSVCDSMHFEYCGQVKSKNVFDGVKICIDPGHGDGSRGYGREPQYTLAQSLVLKQVFEAQGADVFLSRTKARVAKSFDAGERAELFNKEACNVSISIHANACGKTICSASGIEIFHGSGSDQGDDQDIKLCKAVLPAMLASTAAVDRGCKPEDQSQYNSLSMISTTTMPSILIEAGFYNNPYEWSKLMSSAYQQKVAEGIVRGVAAYLGTADLQIAGSGSKMNGSAESPALPHTSFPLVQGDRVLIQYALDLVDDIPPPLTKGLKIAGTNPDKGVDLSWQRNYASDVKTYEVYCNGKDVGNTDGLKLEKIDCGGYKEGANYEFMIVAVDEAGNAISPGAKVSWTCPYKTCCVLVESDGTRNARLSYECPVGYSIEPRKNC